MSLGEHISEALARKKERLVEQDKSAQLEKMRDENDRREAEAIKSYQKDQADKFSDFYKVASHVGILLGQSGVDPEVSVHTRHYSFWKDKKDYSKHPLLQGWPISESLRIYSAGHAAGDYYSESQPSSGVVQLTTTAEGEIMCYRGSTKDMYTLGRELHAGVVDASHFAYSAITAVRRVEVYKDAIAVAHGIAPDPSKERLFDFTGHLFEKLADLVADYSDVIDLSQLSIEQPAVTHTPRHAAE